MTARHVAQVALPPVLVLLGWMGLVVVPDRGGAALDRIAAAEAESASLSAQFSAARTAADERAMLVEARTGASVAIPAVLDMGDFVSAVDGWADAAGVVVEHLAPTPTDGVGTSTPLPDGVSAASVTLGARGRYEELMTFVDSLAGAARVVILDRVELRADEESDDILAEVDLRIFTTERLVASAADSAADDGAGEIAADPAESPEEDPS